MPGSHATGRHQPNLADTVQLSYPWSKNIIVGPDFSAVYKELPENTKGL